MRSVSQPDQPPRFFLDRSLGRRAVPEALRADGWHLITLAEHYGMMQRFTANKAAIVTSATDPGPYIYSVRSDRISRLYP
jgi:hypothetical protein